jgi:hypothetical protein
MKLDTQSSGIYNRISYQYISSAHFFTNFLSFFKNPTSQSNMTIFDDLVAEAKGMSKLTLAERVAQIGKSNSRPR